jgi:hypothetical protein
MNQPEVHGSLLLANGLGMSKTGDAARSVTYLAMSAGDNVHVEVVPQRKGGVRYSLTQLGNPTSIAIKPGGIFENGSLVAGSVGTVSEHAESIALYNDFKRSVTRGFDKVRSYLVGPGALRLLRNGIRLVTMGVDESIEYDLKLL